MKTVLLTLLPFISLTIAAPTSLSSSSLALEVRETAQQATDRLLFNTSIADFETARNAKNPSTLDWTSDGCSDSPDNPLGFDFSHSCHRHDFGYRNYKAQSRFAADGKAKIDSNFKNDLYNQCKTEGNVLEVAACKGVADVYYEAVKEFGSKRAVEFEDLMRRKAEAEEADVQN